MECVCDSWHMAVLVILLRQLLAQAADRYPDSSILLLHHLYQMDSPSQTERKRERIVLKRL